MKLKKLVVVSMSVGALSFAFSGSLLAETQTTTTPTQHHHKAKHHHKHKAHHHTAKVAKHDYKDMGALAQPTPVMMMDTCPKVSMYSAIFDNMTQNTGRLTKATVDCNKPISFAGGLNTDVHWGNRSMGYQGENNQRLALNDAYINVTGNVNEWVKAFVGLSFNNTSAALATSSASSAANVALPKPGEYSSAYVNNRAHVEQAYVTVANFDSSPAFFQIGKQFQDFGRYQIHSITRSMTQVLSESSQTSAKLGFVANMGLHGDVYAFNNPMTKTNRAHADTVYGAAVGFDQPNDQLGYDVGLGWMSDMTGINDVAYAIGRNNLSSTNGTGTYSGSVGGIAAYGDVNSGPFTLGARYTQAMKAFSPADVSTNYANTTTGAKPWAADVTAGYGFNGWCKSQNVYVGYQTSNNAVRLYLPKNRWLAGYGVDMWKNTHVGVEWNHDTDYSSGNGGSGRTSNTLAARVGVKFG